jgi:hypothetical protein
MTAVVAVSGLANAFFDLDRAFMARRKYHAVIEMGMIQMRGPTSD